jgi:hypothetical protein
MHLGADVCELPAAPAGHLLRRGHVPVVLAVLLASSCGHLYSALPGPRHFLMDFPTGGGEEGREGGAARQDAGAEAEPGRQPRPSPTYASRSVRRRRSVIHPNIRPYSATQCSIKSCSKRIALTPLRPPSRCPSLRRFAPLVATALLRSPSAPRGFQSCVGSLILSHSSEWCGSRGSSA